ncbi:MAG: glycosyltransferase family 4 protein [Phycisphaerales bacterium]|nr:glycosyltransferase family 4 protein [Phycisphaerales bacterium]
MRILVIGNSSKLLVGFRGDLLRAMQAHGHEVSACTAEVESSAVRQLRDWGVRFFPTEFGRRALDIGSDLVYLQSLRRIIKQVQPDLVLSYNVKPVIYGSLAAWLEKVPRIVSMITGAGMAAVSLPGLRPRILAKVVQTLYRIALYTNEKVIFQNNADRELFVTKRIVAAGKTARVFGSGVNLERFPVAEPVISPVRFLLIARLLPDKGVREYAAASKQLKDAGLLFESHLIGPLEREGATISEDEVREWERQGVLKWGGEQSDVRPQIARASVCVLPSYREGIPRSTLEAMSMGRPVITTDSVGCRETVRDGVNGFMVPVRDAAKLAEAMRKFIDNPDLISTMGAASRAFVEQVFDVNKVNAVILETLKLNRQTKTVN